MRPRVLFVGLDSADPYLLNLWCDAGLLPHLDRLRTNGLYVEPSSPPGLGNGSCWPSLLMGVNPGKHGRYYHTQLRPGTYSKNVQFSDADFAAEPFWCHLSQAGKRVAVIDLNRSPLTPNINGIEIVDWVVHDRMAGMRTWPPELKDEIINKYGADPIDGNVDRFYSKGADLTELLAQLFDRIRLKVRMARDLLTSDDWDLFALGFGEPHDIGHTAWHMHDPGHPDHDPEWFAQHGDPVLAVYRQIDDAIGDLVEAADGKYSVVVYGGPGMEPGYSAEESMDEVLRRMDRGPDARKPLAARVATAAARLVRRAPLLPRRASNVLFRLSAAIDRHDRKYFATRHNRHAGVVHINLKGREWNGQVSPDKYDAVCDYLKREFLKLRNTATGRPAVKEVFRCRDIYHGQAADWLPDLLVLWSRDSPIDEIESEQVGVMRTSPISTRTGDHNDKSFLIFNGPAFDRSREAREMCVEDFAPTLWKLFDVDVAPVDGRAAEWILSSDNRSLEYAQAGSERPAATSD